MKRVYLILFAVIAVAALIGVSVAQSSGYVLISYENFRYESSLWATLALIVVIWLVVYLVRVLLGLVVAS
jgi:HemY protein